MAILESIIITFPAIVEKVPFDETSEPKWGASFLVDKNNTKAMKAMADEIDRAYKAGIKKGYWKANLKQEKVIAAFKNTPFRDGDASLDDGSKEGKEYKGRMYFSATAGTKDKDQPGLVGPDSKPLFDPEKEVYSGRVVHAQIRAYPYKTGGNGIGFWLQNVMVTNAEHERLDGKQDAEDAFAGFGEESDGDFDNLS